MGNRQRKRNTCGVASFLLSKKETSNSKPRVTPFGYDNVYYKFLSFSPFSLVSLQYQLWKCLSSLFKRQNARNATPPCMLLRRSWSATTNTTEDASNAIHAIKCWSCKTWPPTTWSCIARRVTGRSTGPRASVAAVESAQRLPLSTSRKLRKKLKEKKSK